jgi:hypothetical protein
VWRVDPGDVGGLGRVVPHGHQADVDEAGDVEGDKGEPMDDVEEHACPCPLS